LKINKAQFELHVQQGLCWNKINSNQFLSEIKHADIIHPNKQHKNEV